MKHRLVMSSLLALALSASMASAQVNETYFYDVHGRLLATTKAPATGGSDRRYAYDAASGRTLRTGGSVAGRSSQDILQNDEILLPTQEIRSADNRFSLILHQDGNLVVYAPWGPLWYTSTWGGHVVNLRMQSDGNLVLYGSSEEAVWHSQTWGHPGARLVMQNDGNLVIYDGGTAIWHTGTGGH